MEQRFLKVFVKIAVAISAAAGVLLTSLGIVILFFSEPFFQILIYVIGAALLLAGLTVLFNVLRMFCLKADRLSGL